MGRRSMAALSLLAAISLLCACGISGDSQEGTTAGSATTAGGDPATGSSATAGGDATAGPSDAGDASGPSPTENVGNAGFSSLIEMTGKGTEFFDAYESLMQKDAIAYGVTHISFSSRMTLLSYSATLNDYVGDGSGHKCVVVKTLEEDGLFGQLAGDVETVTMRYDLGSGRMDYIIEVTRDGAPGAVNHYAMRVTDDGFVGLYQYNSSIYGDESFRNEIKLVRITGAGVEWISAELYDAGGSSGVIGATRGIMPFDPSMGVAQAKAAFEAAGYEPRHYGSYDGENLTTLLSFGKEP